MGIEIIFLLLLVYLVLGPKRLPGIARQAGGIMAEFNRKKREFQSQLEDEIQRLELKAGQATVENCQAHSPIRSTEPE
jgi:Sec-independent protein translocase protein TatA